MTDNFGIALANCGGKILTLLLVLIVSGSDLRAGRVPGDPRQAGDVVPGVLILKLKPGYTLPAGSLSKSATGLAGTLAGLRIESVRKLFPGIPPLAPDAAAAGKTDISRLYSLAINAGDDPVTLAGALALQPEVEYAEPKFYQHLRDSPNDPDVFTQSEVFTSMNAFNGWTITKGSNSVVIATVDGGTYWQHEDLTPNLWINPAEDINHNGKFDKGPPPAGDEDGLDQDGNGFTDDVIGWNFNLRSNDPNSPAGQPGNFFHGTATASHFGAATNNGVGMAGTSWNCSLMPLCAAARTGDNLIEFGYESIIYAYRMGARVINCSWGRIGGYSRFEQDVINAAAEAGALVVCAAGNDNLNNDSSPSYPANYQNLLAVGATVSGTDAKAGFSNYGVSVAVFAPGTNIWSAFAGGGYGNGGSGTSYSSPLVAGLAGLAASSHPTWTPQQIATQIRTTADSMDLVPENSAVAGKLGRGRVNFGRALSESHPGLMVLSWTLRTPSGSDLFLAGDTVRLIVTMKNVLFAPAQNLRFTCTPQSDGLSILQNTASVSSLASGQEVQLPPLLFLVPVTTNSETVVLKLEWAADGNYRDAAAFRLVTFPTYPDWLKQDSPASVPLFSVRAASDLVGWAAGGNEVGTRPTVVRTVDAGQTWTVVTGNLSGRDLYCVEGIDSLHAWVGTSQGEIFATTNGGGTWSQQFYPSPLSSFIDAVRFFDLQNGYALGDPPAGSGKFVVLKTTNGGATWSHLAAEPSGIVGEAGWNNSFWWTDPLHGWFGTNQNHIWRTTDGGASWSFAPSQSAWSVGVSFGTPELGLAVHTDGTLVRSTDGGTTWIRTASPSADPFVAVAHASGTSSAWVASSSELYSTQTNGQQWAVQSVYPFDGGMTHLSFSDTARGWAVTRSGEILRYVNPALTQQPLPDFPVLEQNFPNPFNGSTVIRFSVPNESRVVIEVFSLLGAKVATVLDSDCLPRIYNVNFDSRGLASGVYFYRLRVDDRVKSSTSFVAKKLVIIR